MNGPVESAGERETLRTRDKVAASLKRRYRQETRFKIYGLLSVATGLAFLAFFFASILGDGVSAFSQTFMSLEVELEADRIDPEATGDPAVIGQANFRRIVNNGIRSAFPDVTSRGERRKLQRLVSTGAEFQLRTKVMERPELIGQTLTLWVPADDDVDMYVKSDGRLASKLDDAQVGWIESLIERGQLEKRFNRALFTSGDSREPELAGIWGATLGSFYMLIITIAISFPLGVLTAVYLEEFAPRNRWTSLIEVNINNLAAVPSIVFGLLGLAVFINFAGLPRSAPVVGGLVLSLMTLPVIIIAGRAAIKSVPPSIRTAALGVGASHSQAVFHHVLPLAMPGMLTGSIIGMARALGESAPLLMIGMVAFVRDIPGGALDPSTALPVQVYLWADSPERAFVERTSAAIIVLLAFLLAMNATAVLLRRRFERRW